MTAPSADANLLWAVSRVASPVMALLRLMAEVSISRSAVDEVAGGAKPPRSAVTN